MKTRRQAAPARRSAGFALIEVLVAVLLFAIGILGLVGLQAAMTQAQTDSKVRADAANLVDELATLMWAEVGNKAVMANLADYTTSGCASNARCGAWLSKVGKALPGGALNDLAVANTANTYDENHGSVTVTLTWKLPNSDQDHKYIATFNVAQNPPTP